MSNVFILASTCGITDQNTEKEGYKKKKNYPNPYEAKVSCYNKLLFYRVVICQATFKLRLYISSFAEKNVNSPKRQTVLASPHLLVSPVQSISELPASLQIFLRLIL